MDCSPPGPSVHGIFQARVLEWGAIAFSARTVYMTAYLPHWSKLSPSVSHWPTICRQTINTEASFNAQQKVARALNSLFSIVGDLKIYRTGTLNSSVKQISTLLLISPGCPNFCPWKCMLYCRNIAEPRMVRDGIVSGLMLLFKPKYKGEFPGA